MCIYCGTTKYRKIYESHYGPIPREDNGRSYDIHHNDGNPKNNDPLNLLAVNLQAHYDIHYSRSDWAACVYIAARLKLSQEEIAAVSRKNVKKQVENGTHAFLGGDIQRKSARERVKNGTHHLLGPDVNLKRVENGTNPFCGGELQRRLAKERIAAGTFHFQGEAGSILARNRSLMQVAAGTHPFLGPEFNRSRIESGKHNFCGASHPHNIKMTCEHCGKTMGKPLFNRWHGDKCKYRPKNI